MTNFRQEADQCRSIWLQEAFVLETHLYSFSWMSVRDWCIACNKSPRLFFLVRSKRSSRAAAPLLTCVTSSTARRGRSCSRPWNCLQLGESLMRRARWHRDRRCPVRTAGSASPLRMQPMAWQTARGQTTIHRDLCTPLCSRAVDWRSTNLWA